MLVLKGHLWPGPVLPLLFFVVCLPCLQAQDNFSPSGAKVDPVSIVGMTLGELVQCFGMPQYVYPVRGLEEWQDDVVFVYDEGYYYVYQNRVWQVGLMEIKGIKIGESRDVVSLVLGSPVVGTRGDSFYYPLEEGSWFLMLRIDFDTSDKVRAIYIYRTDF